jgi:hypothetical protein
MQSQSNDRAPQHASDDALENVVTAHRTRSGNASQHAFHPASENALTTHWRCEQQRTQEALDEAASMRPIT